MTTDRMTLERYAIRLAEAACERSEDPYHKVGCALIRHDKTVASVGYNGAPSGVDIDWGDRVARRDRVVHAESNALRYVAPGEVLFAATTMMPCGECLKLLRSYGVTLVVYRDELDPGVYPVDSIRRVAREFGVTLEKAEAE